MNQKYLLAIAASALAFQSSYGSQGEAPVANPREALVETANGMCLKYGYFCKKMERPRGLLAQVRIHESYGNLQEALKVARGALRTKTKLMQEAKDLHTLFAGPEGYHAFAGCAGPIPMLLESEMNPESPTLLRIKKKIAELEEKVRREAVGTGPVEE